MSKKTFALVTSVTGAIAAAASAIVTYIQPENAAAIVAAVGVASTAVMECCNLFVKSE